MENTILIHQIIDDDFHISIFIIYYKWFILNQKFKYHMHIMHTRQSLNKLNIISYIILQDIILYISITINHIYL